MQAPIETPSLNPLSVRKLVPSHVFEAGWRLFEANAVVSVKITSNDMADPGRSTWVVAGLVAVGSRRPHEVDIDVSWSSQGDVSSLDSYCTCQSPFECEHTVATLLAAVVSTYPASSRKIEHNKRPPIQHAHDQVAHWLRELDREASPKPPLAGTDQLMFMLTPAMHGGTPLLTLEAGWSHILRSGRWSKASQFRHHDRYRIPAGDAEIIQVMLGMQDPGHYLDRLSAAVNGATGMLALQLASSSGRLFWCAQERVLGTPLRWIDETHSLAWTWQETQSSDPHDPLWKVKVQDPKHGTAYLSNRPPLYVDPVQGVCGPLDITGLPSRDVSRWLQAPPIPQSAFQASETLLRHLGGVPLPPAVEALTVIKDVAPIARLQFTGNAPQDRQRLGLASATLRFDYGGQILANTPQMLNPHMVTRTSDGTSSRSLVHRDMRAEEAARVALTEMDFTGNPQDQFYLLPHTPPQRLLHWLDSDFAALRALGFVVEVDPSLSQWIATVDDVSVAMNPLNAGSEEDAALSPWFDLSLGMEINGQRHNLLPVLPELLRQLQPLGEALQQAHMPDWVYLPQDDGHFLRLPTAPLKPWLQALIDLVAERHTLDDNVRLSRMEALRLGTSLGEGAQWAGAKQLGQMLAQLGQQQHLPAVAAPVGLAAELRPYQAHGLAWLQFLRTHSLAGILADDMGLGKTLQTLAHLLVEKQAGRLDRPALVVAPVSVISNWLREAQRFTPSLKTLLLHGKDRHSDALNMGQHDLVIAPYSLLQRDRERWLAQEWHMVILDEAQNIKNAHTHAAQVASELIARHRLCLTGTPMENHLGELWSLFHFLMPGFLSHETRFKQLYRTPIEKHGNSERMAQLRRRITPFMLRRHKSDVATDLPEKQECITRVELNSKQANLYETIRLTTEKAVREALASKGLAKSQIQILDALLKLRQVCCDPRLLPLDAGLKAKHSSKLDMLMELLPELIDQGRRVLLFSQFTSMLALIEAELKARKITWTKLTGQTQNRDLAIGRFTSGEVPLFLISLKAGGVGLNLTQADTVIHYDPWWNPAAENQATDRAHRIGQTQQVFVYKMVAQGTIEERMLTLQQRKAALASSIYQDAAARKEPLFTENDLAELLKPLG